jgi:hypothetical protein
MDRYLLLPAMDVSIRNFATLEGVLRRYRPDEIVIASAHHGHPVAFFSACARFGLSLVVVHQTASRLYLDALDRSGIALIDLNKYTNVHRLFGALDHARATGRYAALMIDATAASRRRYRFLGYTVTASAIASAYARRSGASLVPIIGSIVSEGELSYTIGSVIERPKNDVTQELLDVVQARIEQECEQYVWNAGSLVLSDPQARANTLSFLHDIAVWRRLRLEGA